jgi:hypothetical protein
MIDTQVFQDYKLTPEDLKGYFTKEENDRSEDISRLHWLLKERVEQGRRKNLTDWRIYAAIDMAYDAPFAQTTPTIIQHVVDNCLKGEMTYEETLEAVKDWGLSMEDLFTTTKNEKGEVTEMVPNIPTFFKVLVPLVKAYVTIRLSKLFTDRNQVPLMKFEPLKMTEANKVKCEVITDIVAAMSAQYGYSSELRQAIFKTLLYSVCLMFPKEAWHYESVEDPDGETEVTLREGLRYFQPHPTRMFYDLMSPLSSINTDTGVDYAGYWTVARYRDVKDSSTFWNLDKIAYGTDWFSEVKGANRYFSEVYPCALRYPEVGKRREGDREVRAEFYAERDLDSALFLTYAFMKLVPSENGMGDYNKPVWFRFVIANEDTVIYAEPLPYCPVVYFGCDADDARDRNSSLGLELVPWQDHVGNILSQIILTAKQNLTNAVFYDKNQIDMDDVRELQNSGENKFRGTNWIPFDSLKDRMTGIDHRQAFHSIDLVKQSTLELTQSLTTVIGVMERLIQFSAQEVGAAASHQQSAQEIRVIANSTSTRVAYTGAFIDDAIDAWKRQLYYASLSYMDKEFVAQVSTDIPDLDNVLMDLGFEVESRGPDKVTVRGSNIRKLLLEGFAATKDGPDRGIDSGTASVMLQTIQQVAVNPMLSQAVGPEALLEMMTRAARLAGAPKDFSLKLADIGGGQQQQPPGGQAQPAEAIMQQVEETVAKPAAEALQMQGQQIAEIQQTLDQIKQLFGIAGQAQPLNMPVNVQANMPPPPAPEPLP